MTLHDESQSRTRIEADFHDARIHEQDEKRLGYAYASVADVYRSTQVPPEFQSGSVLEIGCFRGEEASALKVFTGKYTGIDISPSAIEYCNGLSLGSGFRFQIDDASTLSSIPDDSVDYAFGNGVLHHLDLESFAKSLSRKFTRNGIARFIEPAQGNFLVRAFRRVTPGMRTPLERPLDETSFEILSEHLSVEVTYHALLRPFIPMLLLNSRIATDLSRRLDTWLLGYRILRPQAWLLCLTLRPKHQVVDSRS